MPTPFEYTRVTPVEKFFRGLGLRISQQDDQTKERLGLYADCSVKNEIGNVIDNMDKISKGKFVGQARQRRIDTNITGLFPRNYIPIYVKSSKIGELLIDKGGQMQLAKKAISPLMEGIDLRIESDLKSLKRALPKFSRGEKFKKNIPKRKTLQADDFSNFDFEKCTW